MTGKIPISDADEFYRLLFEQAGTALIAADMEGKITAWNGAAVRIFGAAASEMMGTDWSHLFPAESRDVALEKLRQALDPGVVGEFEFSLRNRQGAPRRLAVVLTPLAAHGGERIGAVLSVRDITNRLILQEQLSQQQKMASLGELAGAFSHLFNNILGGMVTGVDFALGSHDYNSMHSVMEKCQSSLARAGQLVDSLLTFAEGDSRSAGLCDFGELVCHQVDLLEARLSGSNVKVVADIELIDVVEVPAAQIQTALRSLIDNAVEAMPDGGTITVRLRAQADWAVVSVADTGVGIKDEVRPRIFEPFFSTKRGHETDKSSRGLGLAVAHGIVKMLGGRIHVQSSPEHGSEFQIRLPISPGRGAAG